MEVGGHEGHACYVCDVRCSGTTQGHMVDQGQRSGSKTGASHYWTSDLILYMQVSLDTPDMIKLQLKDSDVPSILLTYMMPRSSDASQMGLPYTFG
jgi:hypothetical protein